MDKIKIAAVQMNASIDDLAHNLSVHDRFARKAAKAGCRLVLFPELSATAHYGDAGATRFAERAESGPVYKAISSLARELGIVISYGFCEKAAGTYYNAQAVVGPSGLIGVQRKVHASGDEYLYFRMGRSMEVFDLGFCQAGILVCYDAEFFEAWRILALKGADVVLLPHASRSGRGEHIQADKQKRSLKRMLSNLPGKRGFLAGDNAVFAVHCNQVDYNGHSTHSGGAFILGPDGKLLAKSRAVLDDLMITAELSPAALAEARGKSHATLKTRRPEVYTELTRMI